MKWKLLRRRMAVLFSALLLTSSVPVHAETPKETPQDQEDVTEEKPEESESLQNQPEEISDPETTPSTETPETTPSTETPEPPDTEQNPSEEVADPETPSDTETPETPSSTETPETPPSTGAPETPDTETPDIPDTEMPDTPTTGTNVEGLNFYSGMPEMYKITDSGKISVLPLGDRQKVTTEDGITTVRINLLEGFAANEKYTLSLQMMHLPATNIPMYVGKYNSEDEVAEGADYIAFGGEKTYEADYSEGVLFTYFYEGKTYYVNIIAVPYKASPDNGASSDSSSSTDSSSDSGSSSSSDSSSDSGSSAVTTAKPAVKVPPVSVTPMEGVVLQNGYTMSMADLSKTNVLSAELLRKYAGQNMYLAAVTGTNFGMTIDMKDVPAEVGDIDVSYSIVQDDVLGTPELKAIHAVPKKIGPLGFSALFNFHVGDEYIGKKAHIYYRLDEDSTDYAFAYTRDVNEIGNVAFMSVYVADVIIFIVE